MTAVGLDAPATAAAARAGIGRLRESEQFLDRHGSPIVEACLPWPAADEGADGDAADAAADADAADDLPTGDADAGDADAGDADAGDADEGDADGDALEVDPYALARERDAAARLADAAQRCLGDLLATHFAAAPGGAPVTLLLGLPGAWRPGPRFDGATADALLAQLRRHVGGGEAALIATGNASALRGVVHAAHAVAQDPARVCLVVGLDTLLAPETLRWYEESARLKSATPGRNHALSPAEAVGVVVLETPESARRAGRAVLAEVAGVGYGVEPNPFLSDRPSRGEGLTAACHAALAGGGVAPSDVGAVLADLDGEFHRAKEWSLAETRCLGSAEARELVHPADCYGAVGAASGAVLLGIAAVGLARGWLTRPTLVVCSDDAGECAAVLLTPAPAPARATR